MKTDDTKGLYSLPVRRTQTDLPVTHHPGRGGKRTAGEGKKIGAPFKLIGARRCQDILDEETITKLMMINPNRSEAIRIAVKQFKIPVSAGK